VKILQKDAAHDWQVTWRERGASDDDATSLGSVGMMAQLVRGEQVLPRQGPGRLRRLTGECVWELYPSLAIVEVELVAGAPVVDLPCQRLDQPLW